MNSLGRRVITTLYRKFITSSHPVIKSGQPRMIMTTPRSAAEEALETWKSNPFFDKYASKIAALQQTSPEEFLSRLEEARKKAEKSPGGPKERECSNTASSPRTTTQNAYTKTKSLSDVMKVELLADKSAEEIQKIWQDYYIQKAGLAASIPQSTYAAIQERSAQNPMFLLPLPRANGYEFFVLQFAGDSVHFTSLINYQSHGENAPECLSLQHYTELAEHKGIVLMRGEFDTNALDAREAQCLVNQLQLYYGQPDEKRERLLDRFTHRPAEFKHMDLVAELECLSL